MTGYLIRRIVQAIVVVFGVVLLTFLLGHIIPGGAARAALGPKATAFQIQNFNHQNGYDLPIYQQFWNYCKGIVLHFNLGYSYKYNQTVRSLIVGRIPKTLVLVGLSTLFALILAIPLGILQVVRRNKPIDYVLTGASFVGYAMPAFLLGELLILWFALDLHWFEFEAPQSTSVIGILSDPRGWILPVFSLAALTIAAFSRYMRSSMMEALTEDYIRTARAKGLSERVVVLKHALRNSLISVVTLLGLTLPSLVGGAVIIERIFGLPGMGQLSFEAIQTKDIPVLMGTTSLAGLLTMFGLLLSDVLYAVVDPRIQVGRE